MTTPSHTELAARLREAHDLSLDGLHRYARIAILEVAAALESPERVQGEATDWKRCEACNGKGDSASGRTACGGCHGSGRVAATPPTAPAQDAQGDDVLAARALAKSFRENPREASLKEQKVMNRAIRDPLTNRAFNMDGCATPSPQAEKQPLSEADEALMRQALEALRRLDGWLEVRHLGGLMPDEKALTAELGARLETSNV